MTAKVSIVIVNYHTAAHLPRCLGSLAALSYPDYEIILVDNSPGDGAAEYVAEHFPDVVVVRSETNLGYAGGNNLGFQYATGDYVAVLNPDTWVDARWLSELVAALEADPAAGMATSKILMMDDPSRVNTCGNEITFTGITVCRGLGQPADRYNAVEVVSAISGAAFLIRRAVLDEIGAFDAEFFLYYEDTDLSLRAMLAGYHCLYVPTSIVHHQYVFKFSALKCYYQERNRYVSLLRTLRWRTLCALTPCLLASEAIAWGYVLLSGREHAWSKLRSYGWIVQHRQEILAARRRIQASRRVDDGVLLQRFSARLSFTQAIGERAAAVVEPTVNCFLLALSSMGRALALSGARR